jgi:hypothetical protein
VKCIKNVVCKGHKRVGAIGFVVGCATVDAKVR